MALTDHTIQIFVTGGTFDKEYDFTTGELFFKDTHLHEMLSRGRSTIKTDIKTLMMIDSLDMSEAERKIINYNCENTPYDKILITHGTDRMVETAEYLATNAELKGKTIVLTGAMIPYAFSNSSDGFFNLGSALAYCQSMPEGIYISMNGRCYNWNNVKKNTQTGLFEKIAVE